jgi:hypothetical protein
MSASANEAVVRLAIGAIWNRGGDGGLMNGYDDSQAMLSSAERAVVGLCVMASSARALAELRDTDHLVTHGIFEPLCKRDIPMSLVSALVWPAVAALVQQAFVLQIAWKPTLSQGDWDGASPESPHAGLALPAVSIGAPESRYGSHALTIDDPIGDRK